MNIAKICDISIIYIHDFYEMWLYKLNAKRLYNLYCLYILKKMMFNSEEFASLQLDKPSFRFLKVTYHSYPGR
jgi:hypothetical protein